MRHWKRSAIRQGAVLGAILVAWDWHFHPAVTILALSLLAVMVAGHYTRRGTKKFFPLRHYWQYVRPLTFTLKAEIGLVPLWLDIAADRSKVAIGLPHEYMGSDSERAAITTAVQQKLAIEEPDASWQLQGRSHQVTFTHSEPPPTRVTWEDVAPAIASLKPDQLFAGIGKRCRDVKASIESDSPMLGIGMGTGGGKSNTACFWLVQRLMRGEFALIIDGKRFSHPWAFKDMDAEYGLLPNVGYVRRIEDIHHALVWLGDELAERNERAERYINARGHMLGDVGTRLWVILEELNLVVPLLKIWWQRNRGPDDPKQSPALMALSGVTMAGRAVGINLVFIGQRLDAEVLGGTGGQGGAVRGNIGVRALARYDEKSWKLQAGSIPMPPSPSVPGRIQLWIGGDVHETQVPLMDYAQARELAVAGDVTECPPGMPGRASLHVPRRLAIAATAYNPSDQGFVAGPVTEHAPELLTLRQALAQGVFPPINYEALRKRVQRAGIADYGMAGKHNLYDRADLYAMQRDKELVR